MKNVMKVVMGAIAFVSMSSVNGMESAETSSLHEACLSVAEGKQSAQAFMEVYDVFYKKTLTLFDESGHLLPKDEGDEEPSVSLCSTQTGEPRKRASALTAQALSQQIKEENDFKRVMENLLLIERAFIQQHDLISEMIQCIESFGKHEVNRSVFEKLEHIIQLNTANECCQQLIARKIDPSGELEKKIREEYTNSFKKWFDLTHKS